MPDAQLILIGLRGSGKSTLARLLGEQLGTRAIDLDDRTAALLHAPSPGDAFRKAGQAAFRAAEARALSTALAENPKVLALGGGTPTAPGAADQLRLWAAAVPGLRKIVYLAASPQTLAARLADTDPASRPALLGAPTLWQRSPRSTPSANPSTGPLPPTFWTLTASPRHRHSRPLPPLHQATTDRAASLMTLLPSIVRHEATAPAGPCRCFQPSVCLHHDPQERKPRSRSDGSLARRSPRDDDHPRRRFPGVVGRPCRRLRRRRSRALR